MYDMSSVLLAVFVEAIDATRRKNSIIGLELKYNLKRVSVQTGIESHVAVSHIRDDLEHGNNDALRNVTTC